MLVLERKAGPGCPHVHAPALTGSGRERSGGESDSGVLPAEACAVWFGEREVCWWELAEWSGRFRGNSPWVLVVSGFVRVQIGLSCS